jgi:hypothetical protein
MWCAAKAIGISAGNTYSYFEPEEIANELGCVILEDSRKLSRQPPWAA